MTSISRLRKHAELYTQNGYPDAAQDLLNQINIIENEYNRIELDYKAKLARIDDKCLKLIMKHKA